MLDVPDISDLSLLLWNQMLKAVSGALEGAPMDYVELGCEMDDDERGKSRR